MSSGAPRWRSAPPVVAGTLAVVPFIVLAVVIARRTWFPAMDYAAELIETSDVGTSRSPLLGTWSRWGWSHPGPVLFYLFAPFKGLFGNAGLLVASALLNGSVVALSGVIGWRRGGMGLALLALTIQLLTALQLGADFLVDPWNPSIPTLPVFTFALACWAVAERDVWFLPVVVAMGSFAIQAHVGLAPLVLALAMLSVGLTWRGPARGSEPALLGSSWKRPTAAGAAIAAVMWAPPVAEQLVGEPGNLTLLWRFALDPGEPTVGYSTALRTMTAHLDVPPGWIRGLDDHAFRLDSAPMAAVVVLCAAALAGLVATRRGEVGAGRLAVIALAAVPVQIHSTARIAGLPYEYLLRPWLVIGALVWLSLSWSGWVLARPSSSSHTRRAVAVLGGIVLFGSAGLLTVRAFGADVPERQHSDAVGALAGAAADALPDEPVLVRWADRRYYDAVGVGLFAELRESGHAAYVHPASTIMFDERYRRDDGEVATSLWVVGSDDLLTGWQIPSDAVPIAGYDPFTVGERARHDQLWSRIVAAVESPEAIAPHWVDNAELRHLLVQDGADRTDTEDMAELREKGAGYHVYVVGRRG